MAHAVELGDIAKDTITGFEGVVIAEYNYLNGCRRLHIQPQQLHEGKPVEGQVFDDTQIVLSGAAGAFSLKKLVPTGGPEITPTRPNPPAR